jgi:hypothetical protein
MPFTLEMQTCGSPNGELWNYLWPSLVVLALGLTALTGWLSLSSGSALWWICGAREDGGARPAPRAGEC